MNINIKKLVDSFKRGDMIVTTNRSCFLISDVIGENINEVSKDNPSKKMKFAVTNLASGQTYLYKDLEEFLAFNEHTILRTIKAQNLNLTEIKEVEFNGEHPESKSNCED